MKRIIGILSVFVSVIFVFGGCGGENGIVSSEDSNNSNTPNAGSMLSGALTGQPFSTGKIDNFTLASGSDSVALVIANNTTNKLYAIDIPSNSADAAANTITTVNGITASIQTVVGYAPTYMNMFTNPISKEVYILVENSGQTSSSIVVVKNNGASITELDLTSVDYSQLNYTSQPDFNVHDLTYGNGVLYASVQDGSDSTQGVAKISSPFVHNSDTTDKLLSLFKSNRAGDYMATLAPLDKMVYGKVGSSHRLMGITECAPGFSFDVGDLNTTGTMNVTEYFYFSSGLPTKVFSVNTSGKTYLMALHRCMNDFTVRVDEQYLDGSKTDINANAVGVRPAGAVDFLACGGTTDFSEAHIKKYTDNNKMIAYLSDTQFMVVDSSDVLKPVNF